MTEKFLKCKDIENVTIQESIAFSKTNCSATEKNGYIEIATSNTKDRANFYVDNVDFSKFSKAVVDLETITKTSGSIYSFYAFSTGANVQTSSATKYTIVSNTNDTSGTRGTYSINQLTDNKYLFCLGKNATLGASNLQSKIYNLWFEK